MSFEWGDEVMYSVGLVSDTHIPHRARRLPADLLNALQGVDLIIHAGDIVERSVLDSLSVIAPVVAVAGNMDPPNLQAELGKTRELTLEGCKIGLIHGDGAHGTTKERALKAFPDAGCIVFGHSHQPLVEQVAGVLLINPGSPTDRRFSPFRSCALLEIEDGKPGARIINLGP